MSTLDGYFATVWAYVNTSSDLYSLGVLYADGGDSTPGSAVNPIDVGTTFTAVADLETAFYGTETIGNPTGTLTTLSGPGQPIGTSVDWSTQFTSGSLEIFVDSLVGIGLTLIEALETIDGITRSEFTVPDDLPGYAVAIPYQATVVGDLADFIQQTAFGTVIAPAGPSDLWTSVSPFIIVSLSLTSPGTSVSFSFFSNPHFYDWTDINYSSHLDTNYQIVNDTMFWLESPYLFIYLQDGQDPDIKENSLLTQIAWDWSTDD